MKNSYHIVDILKFIMILLVVSIHIKILPKCPNISHLFTNGIGRIAVPFFFICSGFFFVYKKNFINTHHLKKTINRILILFISWTIIYTIFTYTTKFTSNNEVSISALLFRFLILNPYGHLWYLLALMIGISTTWFLYKYDLKKVGLILSLLLYLIGSLGDVYYHIAIKTPFLDFILSKYFSFFTTTRNGIFFGFPIIFIGTLRPLFRKNVNLILSILFFILLIIEYYLAVNYQYARDYNIFLSLLPFSKFFFDYIINIKVNISEKSSSFFRKYSLGIYLIHPLWIYFQPNGGGYLWVITFSTLSLYLIKKINIPLLNKILE